MIEVGNVVKYVDHSAIEHKALVTAVWSEVCINLVYVSKNQEKNDQYGRQIERDATSVPKKYEGCAPGYWFEELPQ